MNPIPPNNDDVVWRQMLEYLDGTLSPDEVQSLNERLRTEPELRTVFTDLLAQEIKLKELGEEAALAAEDAADQAQPAANVVRLQDLPQSVELTAPARSTPPMPRRPWQRVRRSPFQTFVAMAASIALVGAAAWLWGQPVKLARLSSLEGELLIERDHRRFAAEPGDTLKAGDRLVTAANSHATFQYLGEETEVAVEAVTQLTLGLNNGSKQLQLDQGTLEAVVAHQLPGKPLRLATRQAEAVVVGTRFKLLTSDASTRLEVFEGAVSILQSFEGPSLLVPAGQGVTVVPGRPVLLQNLAESRGTILLEQWDEAAAVTNETYLGQFMFSGVGVKPGSSRARGYLHPPRSGAYSFHVAGSGNTEFWLSDSDDPARARRVWSSQEPEAAPPVMQLRADQRYYLELRCTSDRQPAAFTLSWTTPGGQQRVIYGDYLSPFAPGAAAVR